MAREQPDLVLRGALPIDAGAIAALYGETRRAAVPAMPPALGTEQEDRALFARLIAGPADVWVAESPTSGEPVGFAALEGDWLHSLYVRPGWTGKGVGSSLLDLAKAIRPNGFALWVFESNSRARGFYRRHGLVAVRRTDGVGNDERAPDLQMLWPGADPVAALRDAIDDTDRELARLLEMRAGLTAEVQKYIAAGSVPAHPDHSGSNAGDVGGV